MQVAVVALGKIGLPLAVQFAGQGHTVVGVDTNAEVVTLVNKGIEPFPGEADLARRLASVVGWWMRAAGLASWPFRRRSWGSRISPVSIMMRRRFA